MMKSRFSSRLQVWVTDETAAAYEALAGDGLLAVSDHLRFALSNHLLALGITTAPRPANGQQQHHQQEPAHGL